MRSVLLSTYWRLEFRSRYPPFGVKELLAELLTILDKMEVAEFLLNSPRSTDSGATSNLGGFIVSDGHLSDGEEVESPPSSFSRCVRRERSQESGSGELLVTTDEKH